MEFDESSAVPRGLLCILDFARLKAERWCPLNIDGGNAEVAACQPDAPGLAEEIKKTLGVESISFHIALYSDLVRLIENSWDINPRFQPTGGRTPLAKVRTFLANRRSLYACYRTHIRKGPHGSRIPAYWVFFHCDRPSALQGFRAGTGRHGRLGPHTCRPCRGLGRF